MQVAADLMLHLPHLRDVGVDLDLQQIAIGLQAMKHAVEQVPARGAAMGGDDFSAIEEGL